MIHDALAAQIPAFDLPFPALLPDAPWKVRGNKGPLLGTVNADKLANFIVFVVRPGTLDEVRIENLRMVWTDQPSRASHSKTHGWFKPADTPSAIDGDTALPSGLEMTLRSFSNC